MLSIFSSKQKQRQPIHVFNSTYKTYNGYKLLTYHIDEHHINKMFHFLEVGVGIGDVGGPVVSSCHCYPYPNSSGLVIDEGHLHLFDFHRSKQGS